MPRSPKASSVEDAVQLTRGRPLGYDAERMAFVFTMVHGARIIDCEISSAALDDLDGTKGTRPDEREAQFLRLRGEIERVASYVFEKPGKSRRERIRIFSKHVKRFEDRKFAATRLKP